MKILIEHGCFRGPPVYTTSQSIATLQSLFYPIFLHLEKRIFSQITFLLATFQKKLLLTPACISISFLL